jgi:hypothetical protein
MINLRNKITEKLAILLILIFLHYTRAEKLHHFIHTSPDVAQNL